MDFVHFLYREVGVYSYDYFTNEFIAAWAIAVSIQAVQTAQGLSISSMDNGEYCKNIKRSSCFKSVKDRRT